jgi:hypothetical protein
MEKRDITGKKYYKELSIRPVKQNMEFYCFIAIRTKLEPLEFFADIYQRTNYLFQLSASMLEIVKTDYFSFRSFEYQDTLSDHVPHCLVNKSTHHEQYLLGYEENKSCFVIQQKQRKRKNNQLSLPFEDDEESVDNDIDKNDWDVFKSNMEKHSINLAGKIDYLFPVEIHTYEILQPLFLYLYKIDSLSYTLINAKDIIDIDVFFSYEL